MLESELNLSIATSQRAEQAHQTEVFNMEADVMKAAAERRSLLEKLQKIEVVEDAIRELYVQMKVIINCGRINRSNVEFTGHIYDFLHEFRFFVFLLFKMKT